MPHQLDVAISLMLKALVSTFEGMNLEITRSVGKTETIVTYRGKNSLSVISKSKKQSDGTFVSKVPDADKVLDLVDQYALLGGIVQKHEHTA